MAKNFYLTISSPASSNQDAENATTKPYGGTAIEIIVSKFGTELLANSSKFLGPTETLNFGLMSESQLATKLREFRSSFSSPDFEAGIITEDGEYRDTGVSSGTKMVGGDLQQIITVSWDIYVEELREYLGPTGLGVLTPTAAPEADDASNLPVNATSEEIVAFALKREYEELQEKEKTEGNADASDASPGAPLPPNSVLPPEMEPQLPSEPTQSDGFYAATHYVTYQRGVYLRSEPRVKKGTRLGKIPKNASIYVIETGVGRKGRWSYVKVVDSPEPKNFDSSNVGKPAPQSDKRDTYNLPKVVLESAGLVGYVSTKKIIKYQNSPTEIFPLTAKEISELSDLPAKQKGKDKDNQMADWAAKKRCEIELIRDSEKPWESEYHLVWPMKRSDIAKIAENTADSNEQLKFTQAVQDARYQASGFILDYFSKYILDFDQEQSIRNSDRFCRLKKWTIDATTKQGRVLCLFSFPARYLNSIPTLEPSKRLATPDEQAHEGIVFAPIMASPTESWTPDDFKVPYQKTVKYVDLKLAIRDLKQIFRHYHNEESAAGEVAVDGSKRIRETKITLWNEDPAKPGEYQKIETFMDNLHKLMTASAIQWPAPTDANNNNTAASNECGSAASKSTPDKPHDEAILNFGLNKDFSIRYVSYNGIPLRIGFNCYMTFSGLETSKWRLARTLNYLFYSGHMHENGKNLPWTDWFKMYTFPVCTIIPQEDAEAQAEADAKAEQERSDKISAKTPSEVDSESQSIHDQEKRRKKVLDVQASATFTLDSALANVQKAKEAVHDIADAYQFLFNKVGIDKLIVAIMRCIYLKNLTFEDLLLQLGITAFIESAKEDAEKMEELLKILAELPWECLMNVLADVCVLNVPEVPTGLPPQGAMTDEQAEKWLSELEASQDLHGQAQDAAQQKAEEQANSAEHARLNQIKLHLNEVQGPSGSISAGGDVKIWQETLTNLRYTVGGQDGVTESWEETAANDIEWQDNPAKTEWNKEEFGYFTGWKSWMLLDQFNDVIEPAGSFSGNSPTSLGTNIAGQDNPWPNNIPAVGTAGKYVQYITVGQWEKYTGLYAGQPQDPNKILLNLTQPMMRDGKKGLSKEVAEWQAYLNAHYEEKFKAAYDAEKFKPSWKGSKKWLLKVDGFFGERTCKATKLALDRDHCVVTVGDHVAAAQYAAENTNANADIDKAALNTTGSVSGSAMNPVGSAQPEGFDCPAGPESQEVKTCSELYTLMRSRILAGIRAARKGEDTTEIDKEVAELQNQYYACVMAGNGRIAIGPGATETTANEPTDQEIQKTVAENQVLAEDKCGDLRAKLLATLKSPQDPPDHEPKWPGDESATPEQLAAMNEYKACLSQETSSQLTEIQSAQAQAYSSSGGGAGWEGSSPANGAVPIAYSAYPIPRNMEELGEFIKQFITPQFFAMSPEKRRAMTQSKLMFVEFKYPERLLPAIMKHCREIIQNLLKWIEDKLPPEVAALIEKMLTLLGPTLNILFTMDLPPKSVQDVVDQFMDDPEKGLSQQVEDALKKIILEILIELIAALTAALQEACKLPAAEDQDEPVKPSEAFGPPHLNNPDLAKALDKLNDLLDDLDWPGPRESRDREGRPDRPCPSVLDMLDDIGKIISPDQMCELLFGNPGPALLDQIRDFIGDNYPCDTSSITQSNEELSSFLSDVGQILKDSGSKYFDYCNDSTIKPPFRSVPVQILFDPKKCYDSTIYQKKLDAYLEIGDAFGLSEDDVKDAIDEEVRDALEDLAKLAGLALDPSTAMPGGDFDNVNPCATNPELIKGLQSIKHALNELIDTTFDGVKLILASDLEFVQQVFLDDGKTVTEQEEANKTAELTQEEIEDLYNTESQIVDFGLETQRPGLLQEGFRTKTTEKMFVDKMSLAQAEKAKSVKKSARESSMENKMKGKWDGGEYEASNPGAAVEEDDLMVARRYYAAITDTAGSIFYNSIADAVDININDESKLRYTLPDIKNLQDSFVIDVKRDDGNFTFVDSSKIKTLIKEYVEGVLKPPANFPTGDASPQAETFRHMVENIIDSSFENPVDKTATTDRHPFKTKFEHALDSLFWMIQTYSIRKAMLFPSESNLFKRDEMQNMNLYPMAFNRTDECNIPYTFTDQDFKDLSILNFDQIKEQLMQEYDEDMEACEMVNPNAENSPLNILMAKGILMALLRTYIAENILHAIFHLRLFKFEELISDEFAIDFIFEEMKTGLRKQQLYGLVKDFSKKLVQARRKKGERINAFNGRECLEFLYRENYLPMAQRIDDVIESQRNKVGDFVLKRMVFEQPMDVVDTYLLQKVDTTVTDPEYATKGGVHGDDGPLHIIYPVNIPRAITTAEAAEAYASTAIDAALAMASWQSAMAMAVATGVPEAPNPMDFMPDGLLPYEEQMLIKKVLNGQFTPIASTFYTATMGKEPLNTIVSTTLSTDTYTVNPEDWVSEGENVQKKNYHGVRFMRPLDSFDGVPAALIDSKKNEQVFAYQKYLSEAQYYSAENPGNTDQMFLNLPGVIHDTLNFLGAGYEKEQYVSDFDADEYASFIAYNSTSELSPVSVSTDDKMATYRDQYFNFDENLKKGIKYAMFSPKELKMKDIFKGGGFVLEKYIRMEMREDAVLPPILDTYLKQAATGHSAHLLRRAIQSCLGYANIDRFQRTWAHIGTEIQDAPLPELHSYVNKQYLDCPLGFNHDDKANGHVTISMKNEYAELHEGMGETKFLSDLTLGDGLLRHWFKPIKFGVRLSYVLQGDATKNEGKIKDITEFLDSALAGENAPWRESNGTHEPPPRPSRRSFRTAETIVRTGEENEVIEGLGTLMTYQIPICEAEEDLFPVGATQTIDGVGEEMQRDYGKMTFKDLCDAAKYLWPVNDFKTGEVKNLNADTTIAAGQLAMAAGSGTHDKVGFMSRALMHRTNIVKQKLMDTPEFKTFFDFIIPTRRHVAFSVAHAILWQKEEMNTDLFLGGTKEILKKHLLTALNIDQSRYYQDEGHALVGGMGQLGVMNMRTDQASNVPSENPLWPIILKFMLMTPFLILKGVTEVFDPNISLSKKIYDGIVIGQEIIKATIDPDWNVMKPPFVMISLGMMPSMLPYGVGFPPPPFGPGVGPPLTPFGAAYLAMGLHEFPGFPSAKKKKPKPKAMPKKGNLSVKCEVRVKEYEQSESNGKPKPHRAVEEDSDSDTKKVRSSFDKPS